MSAFKLTEQQKRYLLYLEDFGNKNTISDFSKYFNCSRSNSKKILDRMLKQGLFYKDDNRYILSEIGREECDRVSGKRKKISILFRDIFGMDADLSKKFSCEISLSDGEFSNYIVERANRYLNLPKKSVDLDYTQIEELLGVGDYSASFVIYKNEVRERDSNIAFSMANNGYEDGAKLVIADDESFVILEPRLVKRSHRGFLKNGILSRLFWVDSEGEHEVVSNENEVKLPLKAFRTWRHLGKGIFSSNSCFTSKVSIGLFNHVKKSNYLVLFQLIGN